MPMETYLIYLAAVAVFFATPPDTSQLLIISNSVRHGLRRSSYTIAGDLTANSLQMTGAAFGLAAIIATSASAFIWIKWLGVAYLVWMLILPVNRFDCSVKAL
jgi:homoserine/homoserine lactone efflux protein